MGFSTQISEEEEVKSETSDFQLIIRQTYDNRVIIDANFRLNFKLKPIDMSFYDEIENYLLAVCKDNIPDFTNRYIFSSFLNPSSFGDPDHIYRMVVRENKLNTEYNVKIKTVVYIIDIIWKDRERFLGLIKQEDIKTEEKKCIIM